MCKEPHNPDNEAYKYAFRSYKVEKEQKEHLRHMEQLREETYARKLKEINDRILKMENNYAPIEWQY
jgi:hypothetical protein